MKACTWAVFPNEGPYPSTLQNTYARTYSEWFLTSGYELAESLSFSFTKMDSKKENYAYSEIWMPVIKCRESKNFFQHTEKISAENNSE